MGLRTSGTSHLFEGPVVRKVHCAVVRRPSCSKVHLFEFSNNCADPISVRNFSQGSDLLAHEEGSSGDNRIHFVIPEGSSNKNPGVSESDVVPRSSSAASANIHLCPIENSLASNSSSASIVDSPRVDRVEDHVSSDALSDTGDARSQLPIVSSVDSTSPVNPTGNSIEPPIAAMTSPALIAPSTIDPTKENPENSDIVRLSKKFEHETSLFLQYIAEIKVKDFTLNKKACIQGFISKLQGCHMELLY